MPYTESYDALDDTTREIARAIESLREELEAINYYHQRVYTAKDSQLRAIMGHNRDEEIEHACMTIEWLRRNMDGWDKELRDYLFTEGDILTLEEGSDSGDEGSTQSNENPSLGLGKLN